MLSGRDFEKLISSLLINKGFRSNITRTTGDGGIDIEAYYDGLLFKGKYLVQCKRWKASVGEPVVRDFYGAITSEKALKGLLITSSSFTRQAISFAKDKNIELIDRQDLIKLLGDYHSLSKFEVLSDKVMGFLNYPSFDRTTYELLKDRLAAGNESNVLKKEMIILLLKAIIDIGHDSFHNGLIEELNHRLSSYQMQFNNKSNESKGLLVYVHYINAMCNILSGNFLSAYEVLNNSRIECTFRNGPSMNNKVGLNASILSLHERSFFAIYGILDLRVQQKEMINHSLHKYEFENHIEQDTFDDFCLGWPINFEISSDKLILETIPISIRIIKEKFLIEVIEDIEFQKNTILKLNSFGL
ncbi:MAG: restriction endonuclease [Syntrophomonas sp.]